MSNFTGLYEIRDFKPSDESFILATFLRGNYYGHSWFRQIPQNIFMRNYKKVAEYMTRSGQTTIKVACLPDDPDTIIGYSIMSNNFQILHWCHVKANWRRHGIARALVPQHPASVSHMNDLGKKLLSKLNGVVFDPFAL